jgi:hypothetical protein
MSTKVDFMATLKGWYTKFVKSIAVEPTFYLKFVIVLFIIIATFFNIGRHLKFLDNKLAKLFLLVAVVATLLFDLHTGIILLIAFMMLMIQFNSSIVDAIHNKEMEMFLTSLPAPLQGTSTDNDNVIPQKPATIECDNIKKNEISKCIVDHNTDEKSNVDYAVDSKVKPYEVFVKMMTTQENLDNASNAAILV